jgi:hypothetical protein
MYMRFIYWLRFSMGIISIIDIAIVILFGIIHHLDLFGYWFVLWVFHHIH